MKKILASIALVVLVITGVVVAYRSSDVSQSQSDKLPVAASYYPLYDFARQVGGDKVDVINVTPAATEPHDYEPPAKVLATIHDAEVFIYNGGTLEPWAEDFITGYKRTVVKASKGIALAQADEHSHESASEQHEGEDIKDPHFWLDPVLAQKIIANIRDGLIAADPSNKEYYAQNATAYISKLARLDADFRAKLSGCTHNTIVASHAAFTYVAKRYGFAVESIAGLSPDAEPSPARIAELSDHVAEEGLEYVFFESLVSSRLADTIAQETGAKTLVLDPIEGLSNEDQKQGNDYISVQRQNLASLRTALACQ